MKGKPTMEEFLKKLEKTPRGVFKPHIFHNVAGNILEVHWEGVEYYSEWLTPQISILRALDDKRIVGCQLSSLKAFYQQK